MDAFGIELVTLSDNVEPNIEKMMEEISNVAKKYKFATVECIKYDEWTKFVKRVVDRSGLDG